MNSGSNDRRRFSRRVVLTGAALSLGAVAAVEVVSPTAAQEKICSQRARMLEPCSWLTRAGEKA